MSDRLRAMIEGGSQHHIQSVINDVIKAIIRQPGEDWTTERLASLAGISAFHFHRIFRSVTGETMFAFLQRRRLLRAIELMNEDRFSLTEIALECGFDSGSSLSRTFRNQLGCTPSEYRQRNPPLLLPPARLRAQHKLELPVEIRETKARQAVIVERKGMIEQSFNQAAEAAFRILISELKRVNGWSCVRERIGMCPDENSLVPDAEARYQAGFCYEGALPAMNDEVRYVTIPAGQWVVSLHQGSYETQWQHWNRLYRNWLPASGYRLRNTSPFEIYRNTLKQVPPQQLQTEIWIPIE
ncbi:MAG: AraC family transcriptional regulator [Acidobacteria bacterium]|nr:AraC family transcriptional regulator [Acidobacteriota bacterium]